MQNVLHQTPLSAWKYLRDVGGVELNGRDEGLDETIHLALNPSALTLEEALLSATMDEFISAFFAGIHPFIMIFRDILDFFENADATKGQEQWILQVDKVDIRLEHFRDWIETWTKIENVTLEVPALIPNGAWGLMSILRNPKINSQIQKALNNEPLDLPSDVQNWVDAYNKDQYLPLPSSLLMSEFPDELYDSVLIAQAVVSILIKQKISRRELIKLWHKRPYVERGSLNNFDFWQIIQDETDHFLCSLIVSLSAYATLFEPDELKELDRELSAFINEYPRIPVEMDIQLSDFDSILSLPIWKKRYELYSVWIATEIIRALDGHEIELNHDNGRIAFAFQETLIATVYSVPEPFSLYSERREPLFNPRGKGRTRAVQPDYSLWKTKGDKDDCGMVIEVKHYKKASKRNFVDTFVDYARALPHAEIYLVNHGPIGKVLEGVKSISAHIASRCYPIQHLTPLKKETRERFAFAVRKCVGEPQQIMLAKNQGNVKTVVFDVSGSMGSILSSLEVNKLISYILAIDQLEQLVAIDDKLIGSFSASELGFADLLKSGGGYTELKRAVKTLLIDNSAIIIVTDQEGLDTLDGLNIISHEYQKHAPKKIKVCICMS